MNKQAGIPIGQAFKAYGKHLAGRWLVGEWGLSSGAKAVARILGANKRYNPKTGAWIFAGKEADATGLRSVANWFGHWAKKGDQYGKALGHDWKRMIHAGKGKPASFEMNALRYGMPTAAAVGSIGVPLMLDSSNPLTWPAKPFEWAFSYGTPLGWGMTAATKGIQYLGGKIQNKATQAALDAAELSAMKTARGIADGIREKGPMAHLYGLFNPSGYSDKVYDQAVSQISDTMAGLRQGALS